MNYMLKNLFEIITNDLDLHDSKREEILVKTRKLVRISSEIIKEIHRGEIKTSKIKLDNAYLLLKEINEYEQMYPNLFYTGSVLTAQQEYVEAYLFYSILNEEDLNSITPESLNIKALPYLLGMADLCGELRRLSLTNIKNDEYKNAEKNLDWMTEIYENLMSLDYPNGLIPGLRRKVDVARGLIEKTRSEVITSKKMFELSKKLK